MKRLTSIFRMDLVFSKYILASAIALAVDFGAFLQMLALGVNPTLSSAVSYSIGIVAHWLISSRAVFALRVADRGRTRTMQKVQFVLSALAGLVLTTGIVAAGSHLSLDPRIAKIIAVAVSFITTWHIRNRYVFSKPMSDEVEACQDA